MYILLFTGHPIVNDLFYNHVAFGPLKGKGGLGEMPNSEVSILEISKIDLF